SGEKVEEFISNQQELLKEIRGMFNNMPNLTQAIKKSIDENQELKKQMEELMKEKASQVKKALIQSASEINGVKVIKLVDVMSADMIKNIAFELRGEITDKFIFVAGTQDANKPLLTVMMSDALVQSGQNAGQMVREAAKLIQGGGGGQPHFAQAGGKNIEGLEAAVNKVLEIAGL
ncbi:MAG: DHHA1 domain-containing protein, partial [Bacteroidales bacterium]